MTLPDHCHRSLPVAHAGDLSVVQGVADELGTGGTLTVDQRGRFRLIITELGHNLIEHTSGGVMLLRKFGGSAGLECICYDRGPGIADLADALRDGRTTGTGLGLGLGAARRLSDDFEIHSEPQVGTAILARVRTTAADPTGAFLLGAVMVPMPGMDHCGDGWVAAAGGLVAVIDGLGHGKEASIAARRAEASAESSAATGLVDPRRAIDAMHVALHGTRGAVTMVICASQDSIKFSGVGNISAALIGVDRVTGLHNLWGVVGSQKPVLGLHELPWTAGDVVLLNSDGVVRTADIFAARHLRYVDPTLAAAVVLRDATTKLDDQTVIILRRGRVRA